MNNSMKRFIAACTVTVLGPSMAVATAHAQVTDSIYDIAEDNLSTLTVALDAAELDDLLDDDNAGPYTVFAPIDDAFAEIDANTLAALLLPENQADLTSILTYHVIDGSVMSTDLTDGMIVPTLNGASVEINIDGDTVMVNGAQVVTPDIEASNGVIHLIDAVLMPPADESNEDTETLPSIAAIASGDPDNFSSLVNALGAQGLVETLSGPGAFTVFAPTNAAFEKLPAYVQRALEEDPSLLKNILLYHVVDGVVESGDLKRFQRVEALQGDKLVVRNMRGEVSVNNANVISPDIHASNGIVHVIDEVLVPRSLIKSELKRVQQELRELYRALSGRLSSR